MKAIQRSLWVLGATTGLGLLAGAGLYLFKSVRDEQQLSNGLTQVTQRLERLARRDPYPNRENILAAKQEDIKLQTFLGAAAKHFTPAPGPRVHNSMEFRSYLDNTVAELRAEAERSGVEIPTNYWFSFAAQKGTVSFSPTTLQSLARQLADVHALCQALFDAKVNGLVWLKRVPVDAQDTLGSQDYLNAKPVTNAWVELMPYEAAFEGFTPQLAAVLDGLHRLPHGFLVTNLVVEPVGDGKPSESIPAPFDWSNRRQGAPRFQRPGEHFVGLQLPVRRPQAGPITILAEQRLRFFLSIQAVRVTQDMKLAAVTPTTK
jgi:hypothetical protein